MGLLVPHQPRASQRGIATVELALALPLLLLMLAVMVEFGQVFRTYMTLNKAVESGAQYLAREGLNGAGWVELTAHKVQLTRNLVVYGNTAGQGIPRVAGLQTTAISIDCTYGSSGGRCQAQDGITAVTLSAGYAYTPILGEALIRLSGIPVFPLTLHASTVFVPY